MQGPHLDSLRDQVALKSVLACTPATYVVFQALYRCREQWCGLLGSACCSSSQVQAFSISAGHCVRLCWDDVLQLWALMHDRESPRTPNNLTSLLAVHGLWNGSERSQHSHCCIPSGRGAHSADLLRPVPGHQIHLRGTSDQVTAMPTTMGGAFKARADDKPGMSKPQHRRKFVRQLCILIGLQAWMRR